MSSSYTLPALSILVITSLSSADTVVLSTGEHLEVTILNVSDATIHVRHPILGELHIATESVRSIVPVDPIANSQTSEDGLAKGLPLKQEGTQWNQTIKLGAGYQSGQTNNLDLNTSYHADRTLHEHEVQFDMSYRFTKADSERSANRFSSALGNRWFRSNSKWDLFTSLQFDLAEFQSWDQRLIVGIGAGYELLTTENGEESFTLSSRFGGGVRKEFQSQNEDVIPEGLLGLSLDWVVSDEQSFKVDSTWFPDLQDMSNYRLVTNATWNIGLNTIDNLLFTIGLHHEYDSVVDEDAKNTYLELIAGIAYSF